MGETTIENVGVGDFVTSDGARLGYVRIGDGEPLILLHGTCVDHQCFAPIHHRLAEQFTVWAYDRRGHGLSANEPLVTIERDALDFIELAAHVGGGAPVRALGYSFGATVAIKAISSGTSAVRALVAYEPSFAVEGITPAADDIVRLVGEGRFDEAMRRFVSTTLHLDDGVVDAMARHPIWQVSTALAATLPWAIEQVLRTRLPAEPVDAPPTRVLITEPGGNPAFRVIAAQLRDFLRAQVVTIPGLPHFAMATAPNQFADAAIGHLVAT